MNAILEQVNSAGLWFVEFALPMLVQSSLLILILLLADFAMQKKVRAVFRYWIWLLVLLKLLLPTSLSSPLSLGYFFGEGLAYVDIAQITEEPQVTVVDPTSASVPPFIDLTNIETYRQTPTVPPIIPETEPAVTEPINSLVVSVTPVTWQGIVFLLWLAVVMAMGLLLLQRANFVRGLVAQAKEANGVMKDTFVHCCERMGVKRKLGLKVSANATSPAVCGLFRPVILVPQNLTSNLSANQLQAVLLHELAHIRRSDLWVNLAQTVLQIIYFYNPLLWLANCIIRRVREQAVDEMVLVAMGAKARQYPQTLVNVAKMAFKRPVLSLRLIGVVESKSALAGRIKHILNRPMPKKAKLGILGLAVVIVIAAILLPMATCTPGPPSLVIKGTVKDAQTGKPIAGARVFDDGYGPKPNWEQIKADERSEWGAITNSAGEYSFLTWPEHHSIKIEAPGYKAERRSLYSGHFVFNKKDEEIFDFALEPEKILESSGFKKTFPNGVTVELVGICETPTTKGQQWWRADGMEMKEPEYELRGKQAFKYPAFGYLLKFSPWEDLNYRSQINLEYLFMSSGPITNKGQAIVFWGENGQLTEPLPNQADVKVDVAAGEWTENEPGRYSVYPEFTNLPDKKIIILSGLRPNPKEDKTLIEATTTSSDVDIELECITKDGKTLKSWHEGTLISEGQLIQHTFGFTVPLQNIDKILVKHRRFYQVKFKNISIKPDIKTDVQVEVKGAKWTRVTTSGGKVSVVGSVDGPAVTVRKVPNPEGTQYFKKFDLQYLLEIVSKSFGQDIAEAVGRKSSGLSTGPSYIQKHIGFGIPFSAKGVDGFRKMRQFRRELRKTITEDIKQTLGIKNAGGGGSGELLHIRYRDQSIIGTINIFFSEKDEDITQIMFVIQEVVTAKDKTDVPVEPEQAAKESDTQNQELSFEPDIELEIPLLVRDDDIFQKAGLVDFETGRLFRLPQEYMKLKKELGQDEYESRISRWCRKNGIDAAPIGIWFIEVNAGGVGLVSEELAGKIFLKVTGESWDSLGPKELLSRLQREQLKGEIGFDGASDTFAFRTIEDNIGLLKALSVTDNSIKIRYKMVNKPSPPLPDVQVKDTKIAPGSSGEAVDSSELTGRVVDENGNTVADAQVALSTEKIGVLVSNGKLQPIRSGVESRIVQTDSQGMFDFGQMPVDNFDLIVAHEKGFAMVESGELVASGEIHLQSWGHINGQLAEGRKAAGNKIWMSLLPNSTWFRHKREYRDETKCDESGHFVFDKVPSGWFEVGYLTRAGKNSWSITSRTPVVVKTGQTTKMRLGGEGRPVTGRFVPPEGYDKSIYFGEGSRSLLTVRPQEPRPDNYDRMTKQQQRQWREQWHKTDEYKKYRDDYWHNPDWRQYTFFIEKNGSFRIDDVIAGKYQLTVWIEERHTGQGRPEEIAGYYGTIEVPEMPGGRSDEPLDLGELELTMHNPLRVGDIAPLFEAKTLDGKDLKLIDYRGKFVLLSFWQPVFHPEKQQLQELYDTYGGNRQLEIIGLGGNDTLDEVKNYVRENAIPWPQIYTGEEFKSGIAKDYGGFGIFLIDPDGRIIAKDLRGEKLKSVVSEALEAANINKTDGQVGLKREKKTACRTAAELMDRFLELARSGDPVAGKLFAEDVAPEITRLLEWWGGSVRTREMAEEYQQMRSELLAGLTDEQKQFYREVRFWPDRGDEVTQVGAKAYGRLIKSNRRGKSWIRTLLMREGKNGTWQIAGLFTHNSGANLYAVRDYLNPWSPAIHPAWGNLVERNLSADDVVRDCYIDFDNRTLHQAALGSLSREWLIQNGIDGSCGSREARGGGGLEGIDLLAGQDALFTWGLLTPLTVQLQSSQLSPFGSGVGGPFLIKTREGNIGVMSVSGDVNNYYIRYKMLDSSYLRSDAAILKSIQSDPRETTACFLAGGLQRHDELDVSSFEKRLGLITKVKSHRRAFSRARLDTVYANSSIALAVTSKSFEDEYRRFVLRLSRENSRWMVTDVQIEMRKEEGGALRDFLKKYPDARIVPNAMRVKHTADVNPEQT